jgi:hypothetical protein
MTKGTAQVVTRELRVARVWAEALGKGDRNLLAELTEFALQISCAKQDGSVREEEIRDADALVNVTSCFGGTSLIRALATAQTMVVKPFDGVMPPHFDGWEDELARRHDGHEGVRRAGDDFELLYTTVSVASGGKTEHLILGTLQGRVHYAYYDSFEGQMHAKPPTKIGAGRVVARAWADGLEEALSAWDATALAAISSFPLRAVDGRQGYGKQTIKSAEALLTCSMTKSMLPAALSNLKTARKGTKIVVAEFDRSARDFPSGLERYARDIDELRRDHQLVKIVITEFGFTNYLLVAVKDGKVRATFYDGFEAP